MNFCPNCGTDLKNRPEIKFCFNCGTGLSSREVPANFTSNTQNVIDEGENVGSYDNFDYFDFPEANHFNDFMFEVMEHIALSENLTESKISQKYLSEGIRTLEDLGLNIGKTELDVFILLWEDHTKLVEFPIEKKLKQKVDDFLGSDFSRIINCFQASSFFDATLLSPYYYLFICYHALQNFNEALRTLVLRAEISKNHFGSHDFKTHEAVKLCRHYYNCIDEEVRLSNNVTMVRLSERLPNWINPI